MVVSFSWVLGFNWGAGAGGLEWNRLEKLKAVKRLITERDQTVREAI